VWGIPMLILIISTGILMTIRTGFFQIVRAKVVGNETFFAIFKKQNVTKTKDKKAISQFQALTTALAATIGTGNIAGVATALTIGGPGAIFWMWISAFFGMMTNFSENVLGIFYRRKNEKDEWSGGAMYYLRDGLGTKKGMKNVAKFLAVLFAIFCVLASFGIGNMTQVNSIADAMKSNFGIATFVTGIVLAIIAALVVVGGIKRIGQVTEKLVPFMAVAYIVGTLVIFFTNYEQIPYVFGSIFKDAFNVSAIGGGVGGYVIKRAVTMGFKRGVFSNEAGLGSSVMVHSASDVKEPVIQGMWGIFEVFFDTIIVCTLTSFVLLSSSTNAPSMSKVLANLTTKEQIFNIADHVKEDDEMHLIDKEYNMLMLDVDNNGRAKLYTEFPAEGEYLEVKAYGNTYYAPAVSDDTTAEEDYIYTNIMSIKANPAKDPEGNIMKDDAGNIIVDSINVSQINGVSLVTYAFSQKFGDIAGKLLAVAILLFAFSTVLGWSFYGTKAIEYLFGTKATIFYKVIFVCFIVVGATVNLGLAWDIADTLNGLMAIPNLIAVIALSGTVVKITKNYTDRRIKKKSEKIKPMLSAFEDIQQEQERKLETEG
nr:alanine:cation symporter family protein [Lachnospiraceae bacterium]